MQAVPVITADEFQQMSSQDDSDLLVVLDVRSEDEYRSGYSMPGQVFLHALSIQAPIPQCLKLILQQQDMDT